MTNAEYVEKYPERFKDELDKWLFREFGILGGCCSSIEELKYSVAREIAGKTMAYAKEQMMKDAVDGLVICDEELTEGYKDICMPIPGYLNVGDKVKLIIIKEE